MWTEIGGTLTATGEVRGLLDPQFDLDSVGFDLGNYVLDLGQSPGINPTTPFLLEFDAFSVQLSGSPMARIGDQIYTTASGSGPLNITGQLVVGGSTLPFSETGTVGGSLGTRILWDAFIPGVREEALLFDRNSPDTFAFVTGRNVLGSVDGLTYDLEIAWSFRDEVYFPVAVPEPSTVFLIGLGLVVLGARKRSFVD